eukprot:1331555-Amorphochlora_amoeboformis.AAC.1
MTGRRGDGAKSDRPDHPKHGKNHANLVPYAVRIVRIGHHLHKELRAVDSRHTFFQVSKI